MMTALANLSHKKNLPEKGFTLLEILIALFIFTIVSLILTSALHNIINMQSRTEEHAEQLHQLQRTLLIMSRDIEQITNRPILNTAGKEDPAFIGRARSFTFTHAGVANSTGSATKSTLQRTSYRWLDGAFSRITWDALDQAPDSKMHLRDLSNEIADAHFQYLDKEGRFHNDWPLNGQQGQPLPRAIRVSLTIPNWGKLSQLYVINAEPSPVTLASPAPQTAPRT